MRMPRRRFWPPSLEVYSARQRLMCQKDQLVEFGPRNTALFLCHLFFFVKVGYSDLSHRSGSQLFGWTGAMEQVNRAKR